MKNPFPEEARKIFSRKGRGRGQKGERWEPKILKNDFVHYFVHYFVLYFFLYISINRHKVT